MPKKTFLGGQKNWLIFSLGMYHYRKDINGEQVQDEAGHLLHHTALDPNGRTWKRPAKNVRVPDWPPHDRKNSKCLRTSMWFSYLKYLGGPVEAFSGGASLETFSGDGPVKKNTLYVNSVYKQCKQWKECQQCEQRMVFVLYILARYTPAQLTELSCSKLFFH